MSVNGSVQCVKVVASKEDERGGSDTPDEYKNLTDAGRFARDPDAARECGRRGGKARAMAESKRRTMREAAQAILSGKVPEGSEAFSVLQALGIDSPTGADLILLAQANKATKGDTEAARFVRDTAGEKPETLLNVAAVEGPLSNDTLRALSDEQLRELLDKRKES